MNVRIKHEILYTLLTRFAAFEHSHYNYNSKQQIFLSQCRQCASDTSTSTCLLLVAIEIWKMGKSVCVENPRISLSLFLPLSLLRFNSILEQILDISA